MRAAAFLAAAAFTGGGGKAPITVGLGAAFTRGLGAAALRAGSLGTAGPPGAATLAGATGPGVAGGGPAGRPHPGGPTFGTAAAMLLHDAARLLSRSRGIIQCVSTSVHHTKGSPSASVW
jgi:hypothetical protein